MQQALFMRTAGIGRALLCKRSDLGCRLPLAWQSLRSFTRPSIAPKPVLDIKHITKNPGLYEQNCLDRNYKAASKNSWRILLLSQQRSELQKRARQQREDNNEVQKEIGRLQQRNRNHSETIKKDTVGSLLQRALGKAKGLKDAIAGFVEAEKAIEDELLDLGLALPNLSSVHTPNGDQAEVLRVHHGHSTSHDKSHVDIGSEFHLLDFAGAAKSSGWGWYYLKNEAALLEQALVQHAILLLRKRKWTIVSPPSIVYSHIAAACGFQPRDQNDEQQVYTLLQPEKDSSKPSLSLAATAEIPLAGMYANHIFEVKDLPMRTCAVSRCYRAEAGARGVDTKGLYRVHEFTKVEMFAWTMPSSFGDEFFDTSDVSQSDDIFTEMLSIQEEILQSLGLTYRILEMPATDLGGPATRKRDIEVFFPSRRDKDEGWGEVTSTSICTDYQSRRLNVRAKDASGKLGFPYTLNGTALAVPRILAALLETHYDANTETIDIPEVLRPYMHGISQIER